MEAFYDSVNDLHISLFYFQYNRSSRSNLSDRNLSQNLSRSESFGPVLHCLWGLWRQIQLSFQTAKGYVTDNRYRVEWKSCGCGPKWFAGVESRSGKAVEWCFQHFTYSARRVSVRRSEPQRGCSCSSFIQSAFKLRTGVSFSSLVTSQHQLNCKFEPVSPWALPGVFNTSKTLTFCRIKVQETLLITRFFFYVLAALTLFLIPASTLCFGPGLWRRKPTFDSRWAQ